MGSGKWAVEGLWGPLKYPKPDWGRRAREKGQRSNGAETGNRWKRGKEPMLEVLLLGAQKIVGGWGEGVLHGAGKSEARKMREGGATWGRGGACVASTCRRAGRAAQV